MKGNIKNKDREIRRKIKNLIPEYNRDKYIIGNIDKNTYVQFLPVLECYHINKDKNVCVFLLKDIDLRKRLICPKCGKDLTKELRGEKELESVKEK